MKMTRKSPSGARATGFAFVFFNALNLVVRCENAMHVTLSGNKVQKNRFDFHNSSSENIQTVF
jgi:hypothetical protein